MRRAAAQVAAAIEPPRCLKVRAVEVWALGAGDQLAIERWHAAATRWRTSAHEAGMATAAVWQALPPGRFNVWGDPQYLGWQLESIRCTTTDLLDLATEAEAAFPDLFDPMWSPRTAPEPSGWHLKHLRDRQP